jgi:hypothetical protein
VEVVPTRRTLEFKVPYRIDPSKFSDRQITLPLPDVIHTYAYDSATIRGGFRDAADDGSLWHPFALTVATAAGGYDVTGRISRTFALAPVEREPGYTPGPYDAVSGVN